MAAQPVEPGFSQDPVCPSKWLLPQQTVFVGTPTHHSLGKQITQALEPKLIDET